MRVGGVRWIPALLIAVLLLARPAEAAADAEVRAYFSTYCAKCHGPEKQKGERRFDRLPLTVENADTLVDFQDIIDQITLGEMPPDEEKQPDSEESRRVLAFLTEKVSEGHTRLASTGGRTVLRRINRREYLNTVGDLFALNMSMFDPTSNFPRDQMVQHMDNIGDTLKTSGYLLAQYIDAADLVVEKALGAPPAPAPRTWRFADNFQQQPELRYSHGEVQKYRYMCLYETTTSVQHEGAYGPLLAFSQGVPADGVYEIRVKAEAKNRNHPYDERIFGSDRTLPFRLGVVAGNAAAGPLHLPQPLEPELGEAVVRDNVAEWYTFRGWLDRGFSPRFTFPNGALSIRNAYGRVLRQYNGQFPAALRDTKGIVETRVVVMRYGHLPHIRIYEVELRGPLEATQPSASQRAVLGDRPFSPERTEEILRTFATKAYRRPVRPDEIARLLQIVDQRRVAGRTPFEALKDALKAVLCSPSFLYLVEPQEENAPEPTLSAHALASRLSYFLWSTTPDAELTSAANGSEILKPAVLIAQTRRLLADPKSSAFVNGLLDSWLNLRALGDMAPDRGEFSRYYAQNLQSAMKQETRLFTRDLLDRNDSIIRFLDANYTFANRPLARLYGIPDAVPAETGNEFHRIAFSTPQRGGLLGQGSVLTVSANGIETSPIIRGVWLLENILGTPPAPPPDNVPPIDPDIRGAKSMREILTKHRDNPACFECHRKIDPLGFALENFDPIGAWRTTYEKGIEIDSSGELPGNRRFEDVAGLKRVLVEHKTQFARMLTERILMYACGRRMEPLDRASIDHIVALTRAEEHRFRDLLEQIVLSPTFRSK